MMFVVQAGLSKRIAHCSQKYKGFLAEIFGTECLTS